jgi:hypothetical protein
VCDARVDGDLVAAVRARWGPLDDLGPEPLRERDPGRVRVDVRDRARAERQRRVDGVEGDRVRAAGDDEHVGAGRPLERACHGSPAVRHVVADARRRRGLDALRNRHEHRVGERDSDEVRQEAAPVAAERAEAVHRKTRDRLAVGGEPPAAAVAAPARDLERDADRVAGHDRAHLVADRDDLGDALVPDRDRGRVGRLAANRRLIEVAERDRDRPHERLAGAAELRLGHVPPFDPPRLGVGQLAHLGAS